MLNYSTDKWDIRFMRMAMYTAVWSKDPRRKVGCKIVNEDKVEISGGYNGFPRKVLDYGSRYADKKLKLQMIQHAELNAISNAARAGHSTNKGIAYVTSPCCATCAGMLIQAGIIRVVMMPLEKPQPEWEESMALAYLMFTEAEVPYSFVDFNSIKNMNL